jgi:hypothetical protein
LGGTGVGLYWASAGSVVNPSSEAKTAADKQLVSFIFVVALI